MRRLKVLWLSHFVPYPPKGGAFQRSFNLIRGVGAVHELHLLALRHKSGTHPEEDSQRALSELGRYCRSFSIIDGTAATRGPGLVIRGLRIAGGVPLTVSVSNVAQMRKAIRLLVSRNDFDIVHFDTIGLACYLDEVKAIPTALSHHGAESFMMLRRVNRERSILKKLLFLVEGHLLRRYEARYCPRFSENLVVSELDRLLLADIAAAGRFTVVPNGVDTTYFHAMPPTAARNVVFAGRLDQYSNRDAILYFTKEVWPRVRARFPDAVLDILGSNPPKELHALARRDPTIRVHGFVSDVRPYFERAAVAVCPIRDGGGTRVKILDNLAMGKPIVSTTIGIEGIEVVAERDLLIANSPEEFEGQISRIFVDEGLRARLGINARKLAEASYSWDSIVKTMLNAYSRATIGPTPRSH